MKKLLLIFSLVCLSIAYPQTHQLDSLKEILPTLSGKPRLEALFILANQLEGIIPKQALEFGLEGVMIAEQVNDSASLATLYASLSFSSSELGNFAQALKYGYQSLEISKLINNKKKIASANSTLGIAYVYIGQYSRALQHHLEALRIREELGLVVPTANTLNNIGIVYHNIGQYDKAIEYYKRAQERHGISLPDVVKARYYTNIGYSEYRRGNFEAAMKYHSNALAIAEQSNYIGTLAYIYFNLGIMHSEKKEYEKALTYSLLSLSYYETLGQKYGTLQLFNALGTIYYKTANYKKSMQYLDSAVALAKQINAPDQLKTSYETYYLMYEKIGSIEKEHHYYHLYTLAKDSLMSQNESKKIAEIIINSEIVEKQQLIELLKKEKTISELNLEKESFQLNVMYAGALLSVVVIGVLYSNNRRIQRSKLLVEQKNEEMKLLNDHLQQKVNEVQLLSGLLPICANCKKIRDDNGSWEQMEQYITKRSEAKFSHGICPDCMKALYGKVYMKEQ